MSGNFIFSQRHSKSASGWANEDFHISIRENDPDGALLKIRMFIDSKWNNFRTERETSDKSAFIGIILSGRQLRGEEMLSPGDVVIEHRRTLPLVSRTADGETLHRLVIIISRTPAFDLLIPALFPENTTLLRGCGTPEVQEFFYRIQKAVRENHDENEISGQLFLLLQKLSSFYGQSGVHPALNKAVDFIRRMGYQPISREEIARAAGVSNRQLNLLFQKYLHTSPGRYLIERRIALAKELLASGRLPVNEIARMSGFSTAEFFIRTFRQHTGVTPGSCNHKLQ